MTTPDDAVIARVIAAIDKAFTTPILPVRVPDNPDALLTREVTAAALTSAGYPTSAKTLATMACRGGGPPFRSFGRRPLYRWGDSLAWAEARLSPLRANTSSAGAEPGRSS